MQVLPFLSSEGYFPELGGLLQELIPFTKFMLHLLIFFRFFFFLQNSAVICGLAPVASSAGSAQ